MSSINRQRYGNDEPIKVLAKASTAISTGDMVVLTGSSGSMVAEPISAVSWNTDLATTQSAAKDVFVGVSLDQRKATQTTAGNILVATGGEFEFSCTDTASSYDVGQLFGPAKASGNAILPQQVVAVANSTLAVGRLVAPAAAHATSVLIRIKGITTDGVQALE